MVLNRYAYVLNYPLRYTDPSGEIIFTLLSLFFAPQLLPVAIGADIGWITGGIRGAKSDVGFWVGAGRGALVGAVGGALSMVGGGTFIANLGWGALQGGFTGALDATIWGDNVLKATVKGALGGMAFASLTSGFEALKNYRANYGFKTNQGVLNQYWKDGDYQGYVDFLQYRYGMEYRAHYTDTRGDFGETLKENGKIEIGRSSTNSQSEMKASVIHEYGHRVLDWTPENPTGNRDIYSWRTVSNTISRETLLRDGANGLYAEIRNAGILHIKPNVITGIRDSFGSNIFYNNSLWREMNGASKYLFLIPQRFPRNVVINMY